jgi:hypothetical protein
MNDYTTGSENGASLSIGAPLEDHGRGLLYRDFEEGDILLYQETLLIEDSVRYEKEYCGNGHLSIGVPLGNLGNRLIYWGL